MHTKSDPINLLEFQGLCRQWTQVVQSVARRRKGAWMISPSGYAALHDSLMKTARAGAESGEPQQREVFANIVRLAEPWVTLTALEDSARGILIDVCQRAQVAERGLQSRGRRMPRLSPVAWVGGTVLLTIAGGCLAVAVWAQRVRQPFLTQASALFKRVSSLIAESGFIERFSIAAIIVVICAIVIAIRSGQHWSERR